MFATTSAPAGRSARAGFRALHFMQIIFSRMRASAFSFLDGASLPEALVEQAQTLGYDAVAIADVNSLAGIVRLHTEASTLRLRPDEAGAVVDASAPPDDIVRAAVARLSGDHASA